jgi:hypothetical protein
MKQVATATAFALVLGVAAASATAEDKASEHQEEMSAEHGVVSACFDDMPDRLYAMYWRRPTMRSLPTVAVSTVEDI